MNDIQISEYLDGRLVEFRGAQWRPHGIYPQNYLKRLQGDMELMFRELSSLNFKGLIYEPKLNKQLHLMKIALDKAKRARYFDHIEFTEFMNNFYVESRNFLETLWRLRIKKEI